MTQTPLIAQVKAALAAEEALELVRHQGQWLSTPGGRVRGWEADGVVVELHTPFAGFSRVGDLDRYRAALEGRAIPSAAGTLIVRDGRETPALVTALDDSLRPAGVARYRQGLWAHQVSAALAGVPAYVLREDADDLDAAVAIIKLIAGGAWGSEARVLFLGVCMGVRSLWSHSALLPLLLSEVAAGDLEIDAGDTLTGACVKRLLIGRPRAFEASVRSVFAGWRVHRGGAAPEVAVELAEGRRRLDAEMRGLGIGDLAELEVRAALGATSAGDHQGGYSL